MYIKLYFRIIHIRKEKKLFRRKNKEVQPIHSSMQIWYTGEHNKDTILELDINLWRLEKIKNGIYMDFGLKIKKASDVEKVFIYFPFVFYKNEVLDLGTMFNDNKILKGIFNENYLVSINTTNPKNILVKDDISNEILFAIYAFDVEKDIAIENMYGGTIMSFEVKRASQTDAKYYRFRICLKEYSPFIEHYQPKNSFFESAFIETEMLDFRINEKRNQDPNLMERIIECNRFRITDINFFVMTSIKDEIISDGINLIYKRQLEMGEFWKSYLETEYGRMSVYKCNNIKKNQQEVIDDFSCFAKINYRKSNVKTIITYLLVLFIVTIVFSLVANIVSNVVWHYIEPVSWRIY